MSALLFDLLLDGFAVGQSKFTAFHLRTDWSHQIANLHKLKVLT